MGIEIDGK
jgi:short-chain 2-methylacyl-CoA dehydrogenase